MVPNNFIKQIIESWVSELEIDAYSGESIVTKENITELEEELSKRLSPNNDSQKRIIRLKAFICTHLQSLISRRRLNAVSHNLFNPL